MPSSIIIFEDNDSLRESLVVLLKSSSEYEVTGDYQNCIDAANTVRRSKPDIVKLNHL